MMRERMQIRVICAPPGPVERELSRGQSRRSASVCLLNSIVAADPVLPIIVTAVRTVLCVVPVVAAGSAHGEDAAQAGQQPEHQEHLEDSEEKPVPAGKQQRCQ
jgi:hypothetical protein